MRPLLALLCVSIVALLPTAQAEPYLLVPDCSYSNVQLHLDTEILGFVISSSVGHLRADEANDLNATFDDSLAPNELSWANFGYFEVGEYDLGNIVEPGTMQPTTLTAEYLRRFGEPLQPLDIRFYPCPEPTTLLLAGMASLGLIAQHRSRWRQSPAD